MAKAKEWDIPKVFIDTARDLTNKALEKAGGGAFILKDLSEESDKALDEFIKMNLSEYMSNNVRIAISEAYGYAWRLLRIENTEIGSYSSLKFDRKRGKIVARPEDDDEDDESPIGNLIRKIIKK